MKIYPYRFTLNQRLAKLHLYAVCTPPVLRLQTNGHGPPTPSEQRRRLGECSGADRRGLEPTWPQGSQDFRCSYSSYSCSSCRQTTAAVDDFSQSCADTARRQMDGSACGLWSRPGSTNLTLQWRSNDSHDRLNTNHKFPDHNVTLSVGPRWRWWRIFQWQLIALALFPLLTCSYCFNKFLLMCYCITACELMNMNE